MTLTLDQVRHGCTWQRELCAAGGSPTYVALATELVRRLGVDEAVTGLLTGETAEPVRSAQCLRLFGAVNRVAARRSAGWLAAYYPTFGGEVDVDAVVPAFFGFLRENLAAVRAELAAPVQTNDVGRAVPLSAAMHHVAGVTGLPLRLLEVGASAGLNLWLDRYRVEAGDVAWGPVDSPVRLVGDVASGRPAVAALEVVERRGCDLHPVDVHGPGGAELLRSFVWPEHVERARRLDAALEVAGAEPRLDVDTADACAWVAEQLAVLPAGRTTVVFHSVVATYFDADLRARFAAAVRARGAATDAASPLAWVSLEPREDDPGVADLVCEVWPAHRRVHLATATPHGARVRWAPRACAG